MRTTQQTTQTGFTLIELMIAVAIVALLAAIAVPSYNRYVEKSRRTDATTALTRIAGQLERCYTQYGKYNDAKCTFGFVSNGVPENVKYANLTAGIDSDDGDYRLTIAAGGGRAEQTYQLTATAKAGGSQANDANCATFTLTHLGQKNSTATPPETESNCW